MKVLVAHPTRQHSHRLAAALHQADLLHSYWTLLPDQRALQWLPRLMYRRLPDAVSRHSLEFLPEDKVHVLTGPLLLQKLGSRLRRFDAIQLGELAAWSAFDAWVARAVAVVRPRAVVGYEMCCAKTFEIARNLGISCVLDAAAFPYEVQDSLLGFGFGRGTTWAGTKLRARKAAEVRLAHRIICVSEIARAAYLQAGVEAARLVVNPVGCDTHKFAPGKWERRMGPPKFVFVGTPARHKGVDVLVSSFREVRKTHPSAEMHVIGDPQLASTFCPAALIHLHGKMSHDEISVFLQQMDCLVLPSRLESFGMVVTEALAAGVPVIVSDRVGASQCVQEGTNGWVVPAGDEAALTHRMLACCRESERLRAMGPACTASAVAYDWAHYSTRAVDALLGVVEGEA